MVKMDRILVFIKSCCYTRISLSAFSNEQSLFVFLNKKNPLELIKNKQLFVSFISCLKKRTINQITFKKKNPYFILKFFPYQSHHLIRLFCLNEFNSPRNERKFDAQTNKIIFIKPLNGWWKMSV